jgi:hypothetical protein
LEKIYDQPIDKQATSLGYHDALFLHSQRAAGQLLSNLN